MFRAFCFLLNLCSYIQCFMQLTCICAQYQFTTLLLIASSREYTYRLIHDLFILPLLLARDLDIGPEGFIPRNDISRGLMTRAIWKRPCIYLFITYFARADNMLLPRRQITHRKLCFYYTCKFGVISIKYVITNSKEKQYFMWLRLGNLLPLGHHTQYFVGLDCRLQDRTGVKYITMNCFSCFCTRDDPSFVRGACVAHLLVFRVVVLYLLAQCWLYLSNVKSRLTVWFFLTIVCSLLPEILCHLWTAYNYLERRVWRYQKRQL